MTKKKWVVIGHPNDTIEGEIIKGFLEAQGFMVLLSSEGYQSAIGLVSSPVANLELLVPEDQSEGAAKALRSYYDGSLSEE